MRRLSAASQAAQASPLVTVGRKPRPAERFESIEPVLLVRFTVPGVPKPKARPRLGKYGNTFTPKATVEGEDVLRQYCFVANPKLRPREGHFKLEANFFLPGSASRDIDNLQKLVQDALNQIVWHDDRQVTEVHARMHLFAAEPRTEIAIWLIAVPTHAH